jgi:pimeloyl-ACP methyl ester carboxylesterase
MKGQFFFFLSFFMTLQFVCNAQNPFTQEVFVTTQKDTLFGSLLLPNSKIDTAQFVVLIIPDAGSTDRNGNSPAMTNNSLRFLAEELARFDMASLRYDKSGVGASFNAFVSEESYRFQHNVDDANYWVDVLYNFGYRKIIVIGHGEGALVGSLLTQQNNKITKYISLAGAGRQGDVILKNQYAKMSPTVRDSAYSVIDSLKNQVLVPRLSPWLFSVFRPSLQPYIISWINIDPCVEIAKLNLPVAIIQGNSDFQMNVNDAEALHKSCPPSKIYIINEMNHLLKKIPNDKEKNRASYNNPSLMLHPELIVYIISFIKGN